MKKRRKKIKREKSLKIWLNRTEYSIIKYKASTCALPMARYTRETAIGKNIKAKPIRNEEEKQVLHKITGMSNNINQIAKALNSGQELDYLIHETLTDLKKLINKII